MKDIMKIGINRPSIKDIEMYYGVGEYSDVAKIILLNIEQGLISPIKKSGTNGKKPTLYNRYKLTYSKEVEPKYLDEIKHKLNTLLGIDYYAKHHEQYEENREEILKLSKFLDKRKTLLDEDISINERSFEIWQDEKYLSRGKGMTLLKNLKFPIESLKTYETTEPLPYYSKSKYTPQNMLVIENKDTFYSMRKHLIDGGTHILGVEISTLIYGGGKGVNKRFKDFQYCVEPYMNDASNEIYYLGDIDYEGIVIYESLKDSITPPLKISPFVEGYVKMLYKGHLIEALLPESKDGQNKNIKGEFLSVFSTKERGIILKILEEGKYIPQEILTIKDFRGEKG